MKTAAISKLKANLSEYLSKVRNGDEIIITDRGKPIAKVVPIKRDDTQIPLNIIELERAGLIRIGSCTLPADFFKTPRPKDKNGIALKSLLSEREETR